MGFADRLLRDKHEEAAHDFEEADSTENKEKRHIDETDGKEEDDKIGRMHDELIHIRKLLEEHLISRKEAKHDLDEASDKEEEKVEEDAKGDDDDDG